MNIKNLNETLNKFINEDTKFEPEITSTLFVSKANPSGLVLKYITKDELIQGLKDAKPFQYVSDETMNKIEKGIAKEFDKFSNEYMQAKLNTGSEIEEFSRQYREHLGKTNIEEALEDPLVKKINKQLSKLKSNKLLYDVWKASIILAANNPNSFYKWIKDNFGKVGNNVFTNAVLKAFYPDTFEIPDTDIENAKEVIDNFNKMYSHNK